MKKTFVLSIIALVCFAATFCLPSVFCSTLQQNFASSVCLDEKSLQAQDVNEVLQKELTEKPTNAPDEEIVKVDFSFQNNSQLVDGGVFQVQSSNVRTSGNGFSTLAAYAPAGTSFTVRAYVKKGFKIDYSHIFAQENLQNPFWQIRNVTSFATSFENTGFVQGLSFDITLLSASTQNSIQILLQSERYVVAFMDGTNVVAEVKNVAYNQEIDISQENQDNITLYSTNFVDGKLNLATNFGKQTFVGYFTENGGKGKQYIFADGSTSLDDGTQSLLPTNSNFAENGYVLDPTTAKYTLSRNSQVLWDGTIRICLFAYRTTLSTRITFSIQPNLSAKFNALNFIQGAESKDYWFSTNNPMEIMLAFSTNATFVAPKIDGYKFYRFVIRRQTSSGVWMPDAYSYSSLLPWFANETEDYVVCQVEIVYFVKVGVVVFNGQADYSFSQQFVDEAGSVEAEEIVKQGYVDSSRPFTLQATPKLGYTFDFWQNSQTGESWQNNTISLSVSRPTLLQLFLQGDPVILDFSAYNNLHGKIFKVVLSNSAGYSSTEIVGRYDNNGNFVSTPQISARFGQKATICLQLDQFYAVEWPNQEYIVYDGFKDGFHNFSFTLFVPTQGNVIEVLPVFENLKTSFYFSPTFLPEENIWNASDDNNGFAALDISFEGRQIKNLLVDKDAAVEFEISPHTRYQIQQIVIRNLEKEYDAQQLFQDGKLKLSKQFLQANGVEGIAQIEIVLTRKKWEDLSFSQTSLVGSGTSNNPYKISTAQDLALMMTLCNSGNQNEYGTKYTSCSYVILKDISISNCFWTLIGTQEQPFVGCLDFKGHTISGIFTVQKNQQSSFGIFGVVGSGAQIVVNHASKLYIAIIVLSVAALLGLLFVIALVARKRKLQRKQLAVK